jgi:N-acetylglucosaminyldiphosphoundecaprenol N-acetyl-beta-D-mannosaminyltransferase
MSKANVLGVNIDCVRLEEVLRLIRRAVQEQRRLLITHTHVRGLNIAYEQAWFRQFLNRADLVYCDGMGVKLGGRLLGCDIPERLTLADWVYPLVEMAQADGFSFFFLGNPPGQAEKASARLQALYPGLKIVGAYHGYFDKKPGMPENEAVVAQINAAKPDILLVGFGMPAQERWLDENWPRLEVRVAITCGGLFEYITEDLARGPRWMTQHYLEWLARLLIAPRRYAWRYLVDNPRFLYRLLRQKALGDAFQTVSQSADDDR